MIRAVVLLAAFSAACVAAPALAAGGGTSASGPSNRIRASFTLESDADNGGADVFNEGEAGPRAVVIPTLSLPAVVDGELRNYLFVNVRLIVRDGFDPWPVREKTHFIRDAMLRAGHRRSVADPARPTRIDSTVAREILAEALTGIVPLEQIERIEFVNVDRQAS